MAEAWISTFTPHKLEGYMTQEELKRALHAKGFFYEERLPEGFDSPTLWASDHQGHDYHLGAKEAVLSLSVEQFVQSNLSTQIGRTREELMDEFVQEILALDVFDTADTRRLLKKRVQRLYNELRLADW